MVLLIQNHTQSVRFTASHRLAADLADYVSNKSCRKEVIHDN